MGHLNSLTPRAVCCTPHPSPLTPHPHPSLAAEFAEVDILEEEDASEHGAERFNLEWMVKVVYTIKPAADAPQ